MFAGREYREWTSSTTAKCFVSRSRMRTTQLAGFDVSVLVPPVAGCSPAVSSFLRGPRRGG